LHVGTEETKYNTIKTSNARFKNENNLS